MKFWVIILISSISLAVSAISEEKPICAVLDFETGPGIDVGQAAAVGNRYSVLLFKSGKFRVLSRYRMHKILTAYLPQGKKAGDENQYPITAGKLLQADYVIYGTIEHRENRYWLNTVLASVRTGKPLKKINTYYDGELANFLEIAPEGNIRILLADPMPAELADKTDSTKPPPVTAPPPKQAAKQPAPPQSVETKPVVVPEKQPKAIPQETRISSYELPISAAQAKDWIVEYVKPELRMNYYSLLRTRKESFLGSINNLKEDQDYLPHPFVTLKIKEPYWLTIGYHKIQAKTWTEAEPEYGEVGYTDGTIKLSGPLILLQYRRDLDETITLAVEGGMVIYEAEFAHNTAWRDAGGNVNSHRMDFYDTYALILGGGLNFNLNRNWAITSHLDYTRANVEMTYYLYGDVRDERTFPMSNLSLSLGIEYTF